MSLEQNIEKIDALIEANGERHVIKEFLCKIATNCEEGTLIDIMDMEDGELHSIIFRDTQAIVFASHLIRSVTEAFEGEDPQFVADLFNIKRMLDEFLGVGKEHSA